MNKVLKNVLFYLSFPLAVLFSLLIFFRLLNIGQISVFSFVLVFDLLLFAFLIYGKCKTFKKACEVFFNIKTASVVLILIPIIISFRNWSGVIEKSFLVIHWTERINESIRPSLRSTLFSIALVTAVLVRNRFVKNSSVLFYILIALDTIFISTFLNVLCNNEPWPIPFLNHDNQTFLIFAVHFSWLGISSASIVIWIAIFILSISRMISLENAMGFNAVIYLVSAFLSFIMQFSFFKLNLSFKNEFFYKENNKINSLVNKNTVNALGQAQEPPVETTIRNAVVEPVETTTTETELVPAHTDSETSDVLSLSKYSE